MGDLFRAPKVKATPPPDPSIAEEEARKELLRRQRSAQQATARAAQGGLSQLTAPGLFDFFPRRSR